MAYNFHRDYEKGADKLSPVLRQLIERGRGYPAIEYTRAIGGDCATQRQPRRGLRRVRCDPHAGCPRAGAARSRQHRQSGILQHVDAPGRAGRDAAAAAIGRWHAAGRAVGRAPRQRCAPAAYGQLARQSLRTRRARPRPEACACRTAREKREDIDMNLITGIIGIALLGAFSRLHAVVGACAAAHRHRGQRDASADLRFHPDVARWRERQIAHAPCVACQQMECPVGP